MMNIAIIFWSLFTALFLVVFTIGGLANHFSLNKGNKARQLAKSNTISTRRLKKAI